jgi:chromosome segregation ATPase
MEQNDAQNGLKTDKKNQKELEAELIKVQSNFLAEKKMREDAEADTTKLRDENKQLADRNEQLQNDNQQMANQNKRLRSDFEKRSDDNEHLIANNEQLHEDVKNLIANNKQLHDDVKKIIDDNEQNKHPRSELKQLANLNKQLTNDVQRLRFELDDLLSATAMQTSTKDSDDHQQKKCKVNGDDDSKEKHDMTDEKAIEVVEGEDGKNATSSSDFDELRICNYWRLNGRCRYGSSGKTCRDGYHLPAWSAKNRRLQ